jgi:hypothetical protein
MIPFRRAAVAAAALLVAGCSSAGPAPGDTGSPAPVTARSGSTSLLTPEMLRTGNFETAYDAISALRPNWLRPHGGATNYEGAGTHPFVGVVFKGNRTNLGLDFLKSLGATQFSEIRRINPPQATNLYGMAYSWGVIEITGP